MSCRGRSPAARRGRDHRLPDRVEAVTNTVRHASADTCTVDIAITASDDHPEPRLELIVTDNGIGVPPSPTAGAGLRSLHERAAEVGGQRRSDRPPARDGGHGHPSAGRHGVRGRAVTTGVGPIRVLLVDDHTFYREGIKAMLAVVGADIDVIGEAATGEEAVERALALDPEVVVMDLAMPGMSGLEATRRILSSNPTWRSWC